MLVAPVPWQNGFLGSASVPLSLTLSLGAAGTQQGPFPGTAKDLGLWAQGSCCGGFPGHGGVPDVQQVQRGMLSSQG